MKRLLNATMWLASRMLVCFLFLAAPTLELARALCLRDGKAPPLVWLEAHNHISPIFAIGTPHDAVGPRVLEFLGR